MNMQALERLAGEARALAGAQPEDEARRILQICNACRYCEGFCAMFPAMARRLEFDRADAHYLANLCHGCGACLHACQYAPPHEFEVNVPRTLARVRGRTYAQYAWPAPFGRLYERNGLVMSLATAAGLALFLLMVLAARGSLWHEPLAGDFYAIFPHGLLVAMFGITFVFACVAIAIGVTRFWRDIEPGAGPPSAWAEAGGDALRLKYLDGGHGEGCNDEDDRYTLRRRVFHHFTFYGFLLCFAATATGTLYHYLLGRPAPYGLTELPVVLGTLGGIGLLVGPAGLLWLGMRRHALQREPGQVPMDRGFAALLLATSASGLALLALRETGAMATLLAIHLGIVMAFFLTMPYGKFVHGAYRVAALLKWSFEKRRPNTVGISE
jgi:citrate/tricarballylate utilization protein